MPANYDLERLTDELDARKDRDIDCAKRKRADARAARKEARDAYQARNGLKDYVRSQFDGRNLEG